MIVSTGIQAPPAGTNLPPTQKVLCSTQDTQTFIKEQERLARIQRIKSVRAQEKGATKAGLAKYHAQQQRAKEDHDKQMRYQEY